MLTSPQFWLSFIVSLAFLSLFFLRIEDFKAFTAALQDAHYIFIIPSLVIYFGSLVFRSWRWRYLIRPIRTVGSGTLFGAIIVGYAANNLLPVRLGELVRSYHLGRQEGISTTVVLATVVAERVMDGLILLLLLAASGIFLPVAGIVNELGEISRLPGWLLGVIVATIFLAGMILLWLVSVFPEISTKIIERFASWLPRRLRTKATEHAALFILGLTVLREPKRLLNLFALSLPVWLLEAAMYFALAYAFDLRDEFSSLAILSVAMLAVVATSNLATALPSSQGGIGPFEFFAAATLTFLGVNSELASAYTIALHLTLLVPVTILGIVYLWLGNFSMAQLMKRNNSHANNEASQGKTLFPGSKGEIE